ncbi:hypothetical protein PPTG_02869 [Phytophthora nicotianae INRA-310]|uniref:Uncharacterized protein n=1 Tax=Phytophthora nicotianae (strain INRA-310) TaxID=761204 RepID=W2RDC3_PHYN3|nr:hypothetical protein PPTG_02869 [Phytophthora nicotianae INRA-310]ETN23236.1 hypothetical protein PPTG_02869 [Phytophthora nicotianae INRA-310]
MKVAAAHVEGGEAATTRSLVVDCDDEHNAKQKPNVVLDPRDIVAYAHRIAGTTSAPKEWQPGSSQCLDSCRQHHKST